MSIQTSVRPVRHARTTHRGPRARRTRRLTTHQMCRTAERLGLVTRQPRAVTRHPRSRRPNTSSGQAQVQAQVRNAVRIIFAPGPAYFVAAMLAGMAAAFLVGLLWLY
jgi:hypothetical protein